MDTIRITESNLQKLFRNILQQGKTPKHIAFILDGNRRYARERGMKTIQGHETGYKRLQETIQWSILCGVETITAYVFSINNFNRSVEEVNGIMTLLKTELENLLQKPEELEKSGVRHQFVGDWSLFPKELKPVMAELENASRSNKKITVNLAFAYTGRNEITRGVEKLLKDVAKGGTCLSTLNEISLENSLEMASVDLLIRTGECRLSDFLTWGCSDRAVLCFLDNYWPTFSYWDFLWAIFYFQVCSSNISDASHQTLARSHCSIM